MYAAACGVCDTAEALRSMYPIVSQILPLLLHYYCVHMYVIIVYMISIQVTM